MALKHFTAGALCLSLARASPEEVGTCDPSSGTCEADGGDAMSAMQLRGQEQQKAGPAPGLAEGEGDYWKKVDLDDATKLMPYGKTGDDMPDCLKGIAYMDQQCLSYGDADTMPHKLPHKDVKNPCLGRAMGHMWVDEFLTSFGAWNKTTRCFMAQREGWMFGDARESKSVCGGEGILACQSESNARSHSFCDVGATYTMKMGFPLPDWYFVRTSWGWMRKTPLWLPIYTYYPVLMVVDGDGEKTKWWENMEQEAMREECPANAVEIGGKRGCRKSQWFATRQLAMCLKPSGLERVTEPE